MATSSPSLASVQWQTGRLAESEATCRKALAYLLKSLETNPNPNARLRFGQLHQLLGDLMNQTGRKDEAERAYRQAWQVFEKLVADRPMELVLRRELAEVAGLAGGSPEVRNHRERWANCCTTGR